MVVGGMRSTGADGFPVPDRAAALFVAALDGADGLPVPVARLRPAAVRQLERRRERNRERAE